MKYREWTTQDGDLEILHMEADWSTPESNKAYAEKLRKMIKELSKSEDGK